MLRLVVGFGLASLSTSAFAQSISVSGTCPGQLTGSVSGITPSGDFAVITGSANGQTVIPRGMSCAGTGLAVGNAVLRSRAVADARGNQQLGANVTSQALCAHSVVVLDLATCAVSRPAPLTPAPTP